MKMMSSEKKKRVLKIRVKPKQGAGDVAKIASVASDAGPVASGKTSVTHEVHRSPLLNVETPDQLLRKLIDHYEGRVSLKISPAVPGVPWHLALCSVQGHIRSQNEDSGVSFTLGDYDVAIFGDGCGGVPHGKEAAFIAVVAAATRLIQLLGCVPDWYSPSIGEAIQSAFGSAHHQLAVAADKLNICDVNGGLRTTLIIIIGHGPLVHYGYIGDGGGLVIRPSGEIEKFLVPQKNSSHPHVLEASLGPVMEGMPSIGVTKRGDGDLLLAGTDGIFDRVSGDFARDILRASIEVDGNLQNVADRVCGELAECQDDKGYVCDDNMTLVLMGTRTRPVLAKGFWLEPVVTCDAKPVNESSGGEVKEADSHE